MSVELHLPDLPEVPISLGADPAAPTARRAPVPWNLRLRESLASYLPLLLMLGLALATWWLVKNSPPIREAAGEAAPRVDPDYTMSGFAVERFDAQGRLTVRIEGAEMRHLPTTDRIEIDGVQIRAIAPDGRVTQAHAQRAVTNNDASEIQLIGGAELRSRDAAGPELVVRGEFLHAFLVTERVVSPRPVVVQFGGNELRASTLTYDHATGRIDLGGPMRMVVPPAPPRRPAARTR